MKLQLLPLLLLCFSLACAQKDESIKDIKKDYDYEVVVDNIEIPWGIDFFEDGGMLITEKEGKLFYHNNNKTEEISNLPDDIKVIGQGGLLDVKIHPDFENNQWIYLAYASNQGDEEGVNTKIIRAKLNNNSLNNHQEIYKASPNSTKPYHFGCRMEFDQQGYLYFSIGDRGNRDENPQDINRDGGKIYRLKDNGEIPSDNPFVNKEGAKKAIYSYGHRNPQGMEIHPKTGKIWIHEHGPQGGDEINIIKKGANFGWPEITYGINYDDSIITEETKKSGMEQPLYEWTPSIAPSGMTFVTSEKYPALKGNLLVGSLKFQYLELCELSNNNVTERTKILKDIGRLRSVKESPDGYIYAGVEGVGVIKILPKK
ncbi:MAG: PQQ-dependent sugar dehydrogenase [Bacteroidota bacterium]